LQAHVVHDFSDLAQAGDHGQLSAKVQPQSPGALVELAWIVVASVHASDDDDDDDSAATLACEEALEHEIPEAEQDAFCQLVDIIEASSSSDEVREQLMECLPELSAEQREQLLDAFLEASDEDLAELLESIAFSEMCGWDGDDDTGNVH